MTDLLATQTGDSDEAKRYEDRALGFWVYLMTDATIFALLFATYVVMLRGTDGGPTGHDLFSLPRAFGETLFLLFSSAAFGFATLAAQAGDRRWAILLMALTFLLGAGFLILEITEFGAMFAAGAGPERSGFLSAFFVLVGTHGVHVGVGLLSIVVVAGQILAKGLTRPVLSRLSRVGMFWHFLDIVWIGIFSIVYLPGVL